MRGEIRHGGFVVEQETSSGVVLYSPTLFALRPRTRGPASGVSPSDIRPTQEVDLRYREGGDDTSSGTRCR